MQDFRVRLAVYNPLPLFRAGGTSDPRIDIIK